MHWTDISPNPTISDIFDIQGRLQKQIFTGFLEKGIYKFTTDISSFAISNYIISMKKGDKLISKQFLKI